MSIPCKMRPAGLESLPMGYTRLEFLESTGTQYIRTGITDLTAVARYDCQIQDVGTRQTMGFNNGSFKWGSVNGYYRCGFTQTTVPVGDRDEAVFFIERTGTRGYPFLRVKGQEFEGTFDTNLVGEWTLWSDPAKSSYVTGKIWGHSLSIAGQVILKFLPALDAAGRPCMFDLVSKQPFYNLRAGSEFIAGLTMGQARNLAYLPAPPTINTLTISLPKEARLVLYNQEVNAAIAAAEAKGWTINVQYRDEFDDVAIRDKYAACVTLWDIIAINADYRTDLTSAGEWIYPLPELTWTGQMWHYDTGLKAWLVDMPKVTNLTDWCFFAQALEYIEMDFSHVTNMGRCFGATALKSIPKGFNPQTRIFEQLFAGTLLGYDGLIEFNEVVNEAVSGYLMLSIYGAGKYHFQLDPRYTLEHLVDGRSCFAGNGGTIGGYYGEIRLNLLSLENADSMFYASTNIYHFESPLPKLRTAKNMFGPDWAGRSFSLDKTSVLSICNNIPNWEDGELHELTIGIYEGYNTDQDVLDALALAEEKGWTLTVQWGKVAPPEWTQAQAQATTTYSMRRPETTTVYAKLGEPTEHPDGTIRPVLDWGHYITNWEENGYQEFASIEEAYEHFNLAMPAAEESDTPAA